MATSTINISDIFSKALSYNTVFERQDFLNKYIGSSIYGDGVIKEISHYGNKFLIDIKINKQLITCPQEKDEKLERKYPFLKDKPIRFFGVFTYTTYFGHDNGLVIDNCIINL